MKLISSPGVCRHSQAIDLAASADFLREESREYARELARQATGGSRVSRIVKWGSCHERGINMKEMPLTKKVPVMRAAVSLVSAILLLSLAATGAAAFTREATSFDGDPFPQSLSQDCLLLNYNTCSGWVWLFSDDPGAVWGTVLDPDDCSGGCASGGAVTDIWFWGYCSPAAPAVIGGLAVSLVDAISCPTAMLWHSGPVTVYSCISGDRWTHVHVPYWQHLNGCQFAITIEWGPSDPSLMRFSTDNGMGNLFCWLGYVGTFPGCATTGLNCDLWCCPPPPQETFIYVTDFNGDTILDDLCSIYGMPYPLWFPYVGGYGYLPNNLMVVAGLDCHNPTAVENTSWGRVKALLSEE